MQKLELEAETIQISIYANIIMNILKKHGELSINKMLLFSYLIKKGRFRLWRDFFLTVKKKPTGIVFAV